MKKTKILSSDYRRVSRKVMMWKSPNVHHKREEGKAIFISLLHIYGSGVREMAFF